MPKITIHIYNYAQVARRELAEAERDASRVLEDAGVETEWVPCPVSHEDREVNPACERRLLPLELVLNILPRPIGAKLQNGDTFGYAQVFTNGQFGHYAYLFYDRVEDLAGGSVSAPQLLGGVAAHEIGHLLLGSTLHTSRGLMSARWDRGDLERLSWGQLIFNPAQAEPLRAGVLARCGAFRG
jgi:hypothetical protein